MTINIDLIFAYVALGALPELILLENRTIGKKKGIGVAFVACGVLVGAMIPQDYNGVLIFFMFASLVTRAAGRVTGNLMDWARNRQSWVIHQKTQGETSETSTRTISPV